MQVLEGAQYRLRVKLTNETGEMLPPELFRVYGGAFCPGYAPAHFHAERTAEEWVLTMPGLKPGRVPWNWQVIAAEYATGVEWLLAAGEVNVTPRHATGSGYVDPGELKIMATLDKTTLQMTVQLGESTAACSLAVVDARQSAAAAAASAQASANSAAEAAASANAAADSAHDADGRADDASASAADAQTHAEQAAGSAQASANSAAESAASATTAAGSATQANKFSTDAASSAAMAAGSASEAAGHAGNAQAAAQTAAADAVANVQGRISEQIGVAAGHASAAAGSATAAANSAADAATSSQAAANSASDAIKAADDSAASATAAANSAAQASQQATAAAGSASNAADSATAAAGSAEEAAASAAQCETLAEAVVTHEVRTDIHLLPWEKEALAGRGLLNGEVLPDLYFADWQINQPDALYGVQYYNSAVNPASAVEGGKTHDNAGLEHSPSTDTEEGADDYAELPEFAWRYCNFTVDENGDPYPTALEGQPGFSLYSGDVGVIMRAFWTADIPVAETFDESTGEYGMRELLVSFKPREGFTAFRDSRRADGSAAPYNIVPAFHLGYGDDGLLRSHAGIKPARNMSHNKLITELEKRGGGWGKYYGRISHWRYGQIFGMLKNGTKDSQGYCAGNTSNSVQLYAAIERSEAETWFPLSAADAAKVDVGCAYSAGYPSKNGTVDAPTYQLDRAYSTLHAYADQVLCTGKEEVLAEDGSVAYVKIHLDITEGFSTVPVDLDPDNPGVWQARAILSSMPSWNGETLAVSGRHDGSMTSNTNGRHSYRIQGAEYGIGSWIVIGDTVLECASETAEDGTVLYPRKVWHCPAEVTRSSSDATIKATYTHMGTTPAVTGDFIVGDIATDEASGCWWPCAAVSSSAQGWRDYMYNGGEHGTGTREMLVGGDLRYGWLAGAAVVNAWNGLGNSYWSIAARG